MKKTLRIGRLMIVLVILALLVISCRPAQETPSPVEPQDTTDEGAAPMTVEVIMQGNTFQPREVTVAVGGTVTWINEDSVTHTVTAGTRDNMTGLFDEIVEIGDSFSYTFDEPGIVDYFCGIHPGMDGVLIVED